MRHNPTAAALLFALGTAASSSSSSPSSFLKDAAAPKSVVEESWAAPPKQTIAAADNAHEKQLALAAWSPRPTEAPSPKALMGRMLVPRQDEYTLGPATCGFVPSNGNSFTCVSSGATCTPQNHFVGCCQPNSSCSLIKTTCIDYAASSRGACDLPADYHTLCCGTASLPACYTWVISTTAGTDKAPGLYTVLDCSPSAGRGTLLTYDPSWSSTHSFAPTTATAAAGGGSGDASSSAPTSTSGSTGDNGAGGAGGNSEGEKKSSTNVGAIAGGTVGGVAALSLVGLAAFLLIRRRHPKDSATTGGAGKSSDTSPPPPMSQPQHQQQQHQRSSASPGSILYPSGVPPSYQGYGPVSPEQGYDPRMSAYGQQGAYPQQYPQQFQGQYPPQQQYQYPSPAASTSPPPPHASPSPGIGIVKEQGYLSPSPPQKQQQPTELAAVNPLGAESNRAELGG